jgi:hypothetical protein
MLQSAILHYNRANDFLRDFESSKELRDAGAT